MKNKLTNIEEAISTIKDGMTVMIGGFMCCGCPHNLVDALSKSTVKNLTVISNDASIECEDIGKLFIAKKVKRLIASHIGLNPEAGNQIMNGECALELVPQGTLAERIRCGGAGLGGFLTRTGIGTVVEEGKQIITVNNERYILEFPLKADVALIRATKADEFGNLFYKGTTQNFNPLMATAAETVIAEAEEICNIGEIEKEAIHTPGIFVDYIVHGGDIL